ncbi:hypothetical protein [Neptuniibacter sp. QD37_11]|uniref:hypothetical protein n=1 Tax=Neptuniibacter sp. QD37_11 TaxID=3398209 RepID=UPI0039F55327
MDPSMLGILPYVIIGIAVAITIPCLIAVRAYMKRSKDDSEKTKRKNLLLLVGMLVAFEFLATAGFMFYEAREMFAVLGQLGL